MHIKIIILNEVSELITAHMAKYLDHVLVLWHFLTHFPEQQLPMTHNANQAQQI